MSISVGWTEAGFRTPGSLAIPARNDQQEALVTALAAFLESHPQHENKPAGITAAKARSATARLASADKAVTEAQDALAVRIERRNLDVRRLRVAIRNLIKVDRKGAPADCQSALRKGSSRALGRSGTPSRDNCGGVLAWC